MLSQLHFTILAILGTNGAQNAWPLGIKRGTSLWYIFSVGKNDKMKQCVVENLAGDDQTN